MNLFGRDLAGLDLRIEETRRQLAEIKQSINNLLDLAETFGTHAAAARLLEREAEQKQPSRELRSLEIRREQSLSSCSPAINSQQVALLGYSARTVVRQYSVSPPLNL